MSTTYVHIHQDLIEGCKRGERLAQNKVYKLYNRAMFNICMRMLGDEAAAEDALQESFVNAFRKIHSFEGRSTFGAWLKRIVINKCLSQINKRKLYTEPLNDNLAAHQQEEEESDSPIGQLTSETIHSAIQKLPEGCRVIFTLYLLEGYDHQEIADILGVTVSTSKSQYHRAKKLLRQHLSTQIVN
ncbi:RNA polymerase sigma factor [Pontibacter sp. G13]|uniref:RNA polymerase sigma factor n=1 Tax=Pontibacter sp. G13 TaxID=3074898 RepID=UPI00288ADC4F|nr:RNA polymerase sigma factor [Pontibacter sp. G13]WNJ20659.1 RNA polymerase sigma factor [Pontibacter sp. G13]